MMPSQTDRFKIVLKIQQRKDGGVRVWSDDVPGLVLSGPDPEAVRRDVRPAVEEILSARLGCKVEVRDLAPLPDFTHPHDRRAAPARPSSGFGVFDGRRRKTLEFVAACG